MLVGGALVGTITVGCFPLVPAGERSAAGMAANPPPTVVGVEEGAVVVGVPAVVVVVGAAVVVVVVAAPDPALLGVEFPQAARPRAEAARATRDQVRRRGMRSPFRTGQVNGPGRPFHRERRTGR
jgi:hypothetical protein